MQSMSEENDDKKRRKKDENENEKIRAMMMCCNLPSREGTAVVVMEVALGLGLGLDCGPLDSRQTASDSHSATMWDI